MTSLPSRPFAPIRSNRPPVPCRRLCGKTLANDWKNELMPQLWAAALGVDVGLCVDDLTNYEHDVDASVKKQIDADVGRCHPYDPLLSSHAGRMALRAVLLKWVGTHKTLTYWQGESLGGEGLQFQK